MLRRTLLVLLALALVPALSACGNKKSTTREASTEGIYVDLGKLKYQVQISRQLNPAQIEDHQFMIGVRDTLGPADAWFGVFVRVENESNRFQRPASQFDITDTLGHRYTPVSLPSAINVYAYDTLPIPGNGVKPDVNATAAQNSINGELLLFKVPRDTFDNRPLLLTIHDPADFQSTATVNLDV